jgi:hypothetical protein
MTFWYHFMPPECGKYMLETAKVKIEAEERDTYEETSEEPVAMIEESPPDIGQDGQCH